MWLVFWLQPSSQFNFLKLGVLPREPKGLLGVVTSVFVHGDINHIASNTLPVLVLGMMLFYFYKRIAVPVVVWIWLISGLWLWVGGRNNVNYPVYHIGASTLIYGLAGFLFFSGVFRRHLQLMVVSALVVFLYGGIVWGVFPVQENISWEGHLFGIIAGVLVAFNFRKEGPQRKVYQWEEEEDEESESNDEQPPSGDESTNQITFQYHYKQDKGSGN